MNIDIHSAVGFFFDAWCWFVGLIVTGYCVFTTARNVKRQILRGIVEEQADIRRAGEVAR